MIYGRDERLLSVFAVLGVTQDQLLNELAARGVTVPRSPPRSSRRGGADGTHRWTRSTSRWCWRCSRRITLRVASGSWGSTGFLGHRVAHASTPEEALRAT